MNLKKLLLTISIALVLLVALAACVQTPPIPAAPTDDASRSVVRDFNVPGILTARTANIRELNVAGPASVGNLSVLGAVTMPDDTLTTADIGGFYYPLSLSGNVTESATISYTISAALIPTTMTVQSINYFARVVTGTVACNVIYTTAEVTPTQNTIADNVTITSGDVVTDIIQNGTLGAGYLVELGCNTDGGESANDVQATIWLK